MSPDAADGAASPEPAVDVSLAGDVAAPAPDVAGIAVDASNVDALLEQARTAAAASAGPEGDAPRQETTTAEPHAVSPPPPASAPESASPPDHAAAIEALKAQGYEVTPPAPPPPPPDPFADVVPYVGSTEEYQQARAAALAPLPPLPSDTDPDWQSKFDAHQQAVSLQQDAQAQLRLYDHGRAVAGRYRDLARDGVLGELGSALGLIATQYSLTPEQAARVTQPTSMTDAVAAVVEARDARWQAQIDELQKHWAGEVKRASVDRTAARYDAVGRGADPASPAGGRPADAIWSPIAEGTARPEDLTEEMIAAVRRGAVRFGGTDR